MIQNDEYDKVIDAWTENSSDLNISEDIETIIKNEVAKKWYHRRNMIVFTKHMETAIGLFGTLLCSYLSSIEATNREWRPEETPKNDYSLVSQVY